jgi:hypothetical protein
MNNRILSTLITDGFVEMETDDSLLEIKFRKFFGQKEEFLFILNAKAIFGCKAKKTALKKIDEFINIGFTMW